MPNNGNVINQIRVAAINTNSLVANYRRLELLQFLDDYNHDVIFVSETKVNHSHKLTIKDYNIIRNDRPNAIQGGDTAILIRKNIQFEECLLPSITPNEILEHSIIKIPITGGNTLILVSAYAKNDNRHLFFEELDKLFINLKLFSCNTFYIIAGDLNARRKVWGDRANNPRGRYLGQWVSLIDFNYKLNLITPAVPTFKPAQTYLDICLADSRLKLLNGVGGKADTLPYDSDHLALSLTFELAGGGVPLIQAAMGSFRLDFRNANWDNFSNRIKREFRRHIPNDRNLSIAEIDDGLLHINEIISDSIVTSVPPFKARSNTLRYINRKIRKLQRDKKTIVSLLHRLHILDPQSHWTITKNSKNAHKALVLALKVEFKSAIDKYWSNVIKNIDFRKSDTFFPKINSIFRPKQQIGIKELQVHRDNGTLLANSNCDLREATSDGENFIFTTSSDKLNILGAHYEYINSPKHLNTGTRFKELIDNSSVLFKQSFTDFRVNRDSITTFNENNPADSPNIEDILLHPFCSPPSVALILKKLPNKSSSGLDGIPPICLKHLPAKIIIAFTILFNDAINLCYFPVAWKSAKVFPIHKKGKNPRVPASYRPISLTPSISKVYEAVINNKIVAICDSYNIIPSSQFGFRHRHSTTHAIHKLVSDLNKAVDKSHLVAAAFLDIEKAFDSVWLDGLIYKLNKKRFPLWLSYLIWDMVSGKSFRTWDGLGLSTTEFRIREGLQQGTVNSPILFNIFLSDLPKMFNFNENNGAGLIAYADDVVVYVSGNRVEPIQNRLDSSVDFINRYYTNWNLRLNPQKCETILFKKPVNSLSWKTKAGSTTFQISATIPGTANKELIPHRKVVKYLEVHLDYLLRGNKHLDIQLLKANRAFLANSRMFYNKFLSKKANLFFTCC